MPNSTKKPAAAKSGGRTSDKAGQVRENLQRLVPPHNTEAEQAVLSGVFLRENLMHELVDIIGPSDFYIPAHQKIFQVYIDLYRSGKSVDEVTVYDRLHSLQQLEEVGGAVYLAELSRAVLSGANAAHWAQLVRDKALQRRLIDASADIISEAYGPVVDVPLLLDNAEKAIFDISEGLNQQTLSSSKQLLDSTFEALTKRFENRDSTTGLATGYYELDNMTAGLQKSDLLIIAARPSMGKTAFAVNLAMRSALKSKATVAVFSLEMSSESLMERMLSTYAKVNLASLRRGFIQSEDWVRLQQAADDLGKAKIFIDDTAALTPLALRAKCRRLMAQHGLDLVVVDYLQLMRSARTDSRELEISDISRNLKALAKELKIPVIALSQLNRKVEERVNKTPMLSDLRESGAIEQDADIIIFIHREDAYKKKDDPTRTNLADIIIGKHRNGPTGSFQLAYRAEFTAFENLDFSSVEPSD